VGKLVALLLVVLAAGVLVAWLRGGDDRTAKARRGRLQLVAWAIAALVLLAFVAFLAMRSPNAAPAGSKPTLLLIGVAAALILAVWPWLARRIIPPALIGAGLVGFVVAHADLNTGGTFFGTQSAAATPAPKLCAAPCGTSPVPLPALPTLGQDFLLPVAYLLVLVGGWLAWRSADPVLARGRLLLGRVNELAPRAQLRSLLLLLVMVIAAELLIPGNWTPAAAFAFALALTLGVGVAMLRQWPGAAARLAVAGLLFLGAAGLVLALTFQYGYAPSDYGVVVLGSRSSPGMVTAQAVVLLALAAWLAPQTFPRVRRILGLPPDAELTRQVLQLTESRAVAVDTAASDLRRLERDLHDGAQARLVALGMSLRAAERLIPVSPEAGLALVAEARETAAKALTDLRELVRGVLPPVLADRGLADAVRALALDSPLAVETGIDLPGRVARPVETACYFAVAELLTNAAKHSGARDARIEICHTGGRLRIEVTDFGLGGADPGAGSGLAGVEKRLATFDGIMAISSPPGGPTIVVLEVPCALSSPKTSSY